LAPATTKESSPIGTAPFISFFFALGFTMAKSVTLSRWRATAEKIFNDNLNEYMVSSNTFTFGESEIEWKSGPSEGKSKYDVLKKIKEDNKYYYLYHSSFSAWVIPKCIFKGKEESQI
jgi:hypothetical protein